MGMNALTGSPFCKTLKGGLEIAQSTVLGVIYMGSKMDGLYVVKGDKHTYTSKGFNQDNYTIIGVAPFPKTGTSIFLNWKENPLP